MISNFFGKKKTDEVKDEIKSDFEIEEDDEDMEQGKQLLLVV